MRIYKYRGVHVVCKYAITCYITTCNQVRVSKIIGPKKLSEANTVPFIELYYSTKNLGPLTWAICTLSTELQLHWAEGSLSVSPFTHTDWCLSWWATTSTYSLRPPRNMKAWEQEANLTCIMTLWISMISGDV